MNGDVLQPAGPRAGVRFDTTHWSVVRRAGAAAAGSPEDARAAMGGLVETYWYPLYAFARRRGHADHDAMDLTQGFFAHLMGGDALGSVSPEKGRFRSFLLAAFTNYMSNQRRAAGARRRGGAATVLPLHPAGGADGFSDRYAHEPADHETPERLFERSFVEALLARVRARLAGDYAAAGRAELFALLEPHLLHRPDAAPRAEVGRRLGLSPAAVNMSLHRVRRRYGELLREEVALTVDDPADVDAEIRELLAIVARAG
ncbi:MAG TPA: sigma factor [Humisphaera sp.]